MNLDDQNHLDQLARINELQRLQRQQAIDETAQIIDNMAGVNAQYVTQRIATRDQLAKIHAEASIDAIGKGAAQTIQQVVASPDFLQ